MAEDERDRAEQPSARTRRLDDPVVMRAMAHPLRIQLLELLGLHGALTATECAERTGESPASCSFHLRMLAKYGFIEEAEGGTGRQRPWRRTSLGHSWESGPSAPPGTREAAETLSGVVRARNLSLLEDYLAHAAEFGPEWSDALIHSDFNSFLTAAELADLGRRTHALWEPFLDRLDDPSRRPDGARPVQLLAFGFPRRDQAPAHEQEDRGA
jgi:DNA-binding transcriptional ArsR family regulator